MKIHDGTPGEQARYLSRSVLLPAPRLNPRVYLAGIDELAVSMREHGQIEPLIVRPAPGAGGYGYEIGAGMRRYLAAEVAGLDELLCFVRDLSDREMVELSLAENKDRLELHPLEEGEAFRRLHYGWKELGLDQAVPVDEIAARAHRSKAYVYGRIRLVSDLCERGKTLFAAWQIDARGALALLRVTDHQRQERVLEDLLKHRPIGHVVRAEDIEACVKERYLLSLLDAKFPKKDADLDPIAGPCTVCPKRSGNQPELFDVGKSADLCTDPDCFEGKKSAWVNRAFTQANAEGLPVLEKSAAKMVFKTGAAVAYDSPWVALDGECYEDGKQRTYKALLGKDVKASAWVIDPEGWPRPLVRREDAVKGLRVAGHDLIAADVERAGDVQAKVKAEEVKADKSAKAKADAAARRRAVDQCLLALGRAAGEKKPTRKALTLLAKGVLAVTWADVKSEYVKRHSLDDTGAKGSKNERIDKLLIAKVGTMTEADLLGFLFEIVLSRGAYVVAEGSKDARRTTPLFETFEAFGIDYDAAFTSEKKAVLKPAVKTAKKTASKPSK